jgi:hypothetical protein
MYREHDGVILLRDIDESRIAPRGPGKMSSVDGHAVASKGTHGAIVNLPNQNELMVELFDAEGKTIGLADVEAAEVRPATKADYASVARSKA